MGYAFISYSTKNQAEGDAVRNLFHKKGIRTWMAPYDIPVSSVYASEITRAIKDCACFVLLLSEFSQSSMWVDKEVERALSYKKSVVVIQLEDIILNNSFEFYLGNCQIQSLKKIDENAEGFSKILDAVIALAGTDIPVEKAPAAPVKLPVAEKVPNVERAKPTPPPKEAPKPPKKEEPEMVLIPLSKGKEKIIKALHWLDAITALCIIIAIFLLVKIPNVYVPLATFLGIHTLLSASTIAESAILSGEKFKHPEATEDADGAVAILFVAHLAILVMNIVFMFLAPVFKLYAFAFSVAGLTHYVAATVLLRKCDFKDCAGIFAVIFAVLTVISACVYFL